MIIMALMSEHVDPTNTCWASPISPSMSRGLHWYGTAVPLAIRAFLPHTGTSDLVKEPSKVRVAEGTTCWILESGMEGNAGRLRWEDSICDKNLNTHIIKGLCWNQTLIWGKATNIPVWIWYEQEQDDDGQGMKGKIPQIPQNYNPT